MGSSFLINYIDENHLSSLRYMSSISNCFMDNGIWINSELSNNLMDRSFEQNVVTEKFIHTQIVQWDNKGYKTWN